LKKLERRKSGWSLFSNKKELEAEMTQKMEAVLQETLLKNIQLQHDINTLGTEVQKLQDELKVYHQSSK